MLKLELVQTTMGLKTMRGSVCRESQMKQVQHASLKRPVAYNSGRTALNISFIGQLGMCHRPGFGGIKK